MEDRKSSKPEKEERNICELFENVVEKNPTKIAAIFENSQLTYEELDQKSTRLARYLISQRIVPGTIVGLSVDCDFNLRIGIFGILKAGGAYLPLDYNYPKERLRWMIEDANPILILTDSKIAHHFNGYQTRVIPMDNLGPITDREEPLINPVLSPEQLAYVVYTSGSTGKPKGIMIPHRSLPHAALAHADYYPNPIIALVTGSISFDASILTIFHTLIAGGTLVLIGQTFLIDADKISNLIHANSVNYILSVPSFYSMLLDESRDFPKLKHVSLAGENLPRDLPELHAKSAPNAYLYNEYGPSECAIGATLAKIYDPLERKIEKITIGKPQPDTQVYLLNEKMELVSPGERGEICIAGIGLALGYLNRPDLTASKFVEVSLDGQSVLRLYRTGDYGRILPDGNLDFLGRIDHQIKIRGYRIELGEIETTICQYEGIKEAVVIVREDAQGNKRLVAYYTSIGNVDLSSGLREYLNRNLLNVMVPSTLMRVERFSLTANGKIDREALPKVKEPSINHVKTENELENALLAIWKRILNHEIVGIHDNFFDLGGDSLSLARVQTAIQKELGLKIPIVDLFHYPTIAQLAKNLCSLSPKENQVQRKIQPEKSTNAIAIVGMAGRFPGAKNIQEFWDNLCQGKETISTFEKLDPLPNYVNSKAILDGIELFDANFFGFTTKEAELTDPQHRLFLECAWEALENAGYCPENFAGSIGVYGGTGLSTYFLNNIYPNEQLRGSFGDYLLQIGNEKDFLTTRVSYKLNLKGPSLTIQTACSTSLVSICLACDHLLNHKCDMALAGGVSIVVPQEKGYIYQEGMIFSSDGHCRPFDAKAKGTVPGNGVGIVVLKRLEDAIADKDHIYAVIRGYGLNNDGSEKVGFAAPSIKGQAEVIRSAISMAGIEPKTISYVEAHGTGTILGDPIEIQALTQAFQTNEKGFCALGSLKSNMGHLIEAAGIAGLMKTALSLYHGMIPPTLHYNQPNPHIDFENSPFKVNTRLKEWNQCDSPRRACVSSFGMGGTNAHAVLEEAPRIIPSENSMSEHLLVLSARTSTALKKMAENLAQYLQNNPQFSLTDVAYTLRIGRRSFAHRAVFSCRNIEEAISKLVNFESTEIESLSPIQLGRRIPLPTYPFEKKRYWVDPPQRVEIKPQEGISHGDKESFLLTLWKDLLGHESIGIEDDFFQLGGDSLLAIQVITKIQAVYGVSLGLQGLIEYPTISKLAKAIEVKSVAASSLIKLKNGTEDRPLFLFHPIEGNVLCYRTLTETLKCTNSIYGIKAAYSDARSIEELASRYIIDIRKVQPKGPYYLLGSSFGGIIAYEIARQLKASGDSIELLCMLDIIRPGHPSLPTCNDALLVHLHELLEGKPVTPDEVKSNRLMEIMRLGALPLEEQQKIYDQIKLHLHALSKYKPGSYDGRVLFFQAKDRFFRNNDLCLGSTWKEVVKGEVEVHEIPGSHINMMASPHVENLADLIEKNL
jgi:polyketide synthase PksJ